MSSPHDNPRIAPGAILLDRYKAVRVVGAGGMGLVVHAVHLIEGTEVAIKFLLPQFASSREAAQRFVREARAAAKVPSAHITRVIDTGTSAELGPYIAMEFLPGEDLSKHVRAGLRATIQVGVDYIVQAGDAIAHAHTVGVIHRDVKPANMFLVNEPGGGQVVKVLDFGISKVVEEAPLEITKTSTLLGSGLYMSPEQMRSAKTVDHRTDIYSLGISLYELFSGTQPFVADSYPDLCIKVTMQPPDPLRQHRPDIPEELAAVIAKAYARAPADRYQSVPEFMVALSPWATPETLKRIDTIAHLGRTRAPLASADFQSVAPPPPPMPHPGATTLPMAPRLPQISAPTDARPSDGRASDPRQSDARQSDPRQSDARQSDPARGSSPALPGTSTPPAGMPATNAPSGAPPAALGESSAKSFTKTASQDATARTVFLAAGGTFAVGCAAVLGYVAWLNHSHPAPSKKAPQVSASVGVSASSNASAVVAANESAPPLTAPSAPTVSVDATPTASSSVSATSASAAPTSTAKPKKPKVTPSATPHAAGSSDKPPSDPYNCIDPVTKLRGPCR